LEASILPTKEQREYLKEWLERVDDLLDPPLDVVQLPDNGLALWEAYFWGRIALHFHIRVGVRGQWGACNLCADFKVFRGMPEIEFETFNGTFFELECGGRYQYGGYHPVFICVGEGPEDGECVPLRLASYVRLKPMDDCTMSGEYILEGVRFLKLFRDDILVGAFDNYRKSGSPRSTARKFLSSGPDKGELPNEMVEDTPQVVYGIPDEHAQSASRQLGGVRNLEDIVSKLRFELTAEAYAVRWVDEESRPDFFIVEDVAMFPRPVKFSPETRNVGAVTHG
jgi:hypothetical protein